MSFTKTIFLFSFFCLNSLAMQTAFDDDIKFNANGNSLSATANNKQDDFFVQWRDLKYTGYKQVQTRVGPMRYILTEDQARELYGAISALYNQQQNSKLHK